jgi:TorA maturation chaperone TorD
MLGDKTMLSHTAATAYARRDFWLCLARAFAPPATGPDYLRAFQSDLPDDLDAIAEEMGLAIGAEIRSLKEVAARIAEPLELRKLYAALFLTPPTPVMLNACFYMDGGLKGAAEQALDEIYARHGFQRNSHFRDLNDTVGVQAEFLALLYDRAGDKAKAGEDIDARAYLSQAEAFVAEYPCRWITPFLRDLEAASRDQGVNPVYAYLARMIWLSVEGSVAAPEVIQIKAGMASLPRGSARGIGALTAEDLAEIAWCLERDGLTWNHVAQNEGWDDAVFAARQARGENTQGDSVEAVH